MRIGLITFSAVTAAAALFSSGCSSDQPKEKPAQPEMRVMGEATTPPSKGKDSDEIAPTNESIGFEIRRLLNSEPSNTAGIVVQVDDGVVTLRGSAPSPAAAWRAQGMANSVKGVKSVVNLIAVKNPNSTP